MTKNDLIIEKARRSYRLGKLNLATHYCRIILDEDQYDEDALHLLGAILNHAGLSKRAKKIFQKAFHSTLPTRANLSDYGCILLKLGEYNEAISIFQIVITESPEQPEAWLGLGKAKLATDSVVGAIEAFQRV